MITYKSETTNTSRDRFSICHKPVLHLSLHLSLRSAEGAFAMTDVRKNDTSMTNVVNICHGTYSPYINVIKTL